MVIDLSSGGMILLVVGTHVFTGCLGFVLGCCMRMAGKNRRRSHEPAGKRLYQRWLPLAERRGMQPRMRVQEGAVRENDAICRSAYRQRGAEEDGFCLGDMV